MDNYTFFKYSIPEPNDGENYRFTLQELDELLEKTYSCGWNQAKSIYSPTVTASWAYYENKDDNTRWKEIWIK